MARPLSTRIHGAHATWIEESAEPTEPMQRERSPKRITRRQGGRTVSRGKRGGYKKQWSTDHEKAAQHGAPPTYAVLSEAPQELVERASTEKLVWIQRFVREGCPRGKLLQYAREAAGAIGQNPGAVPPYTTLNTWVHRYKLYGLVGLVDAVRSDAGKSRVLDTEDVEKATQAFVGGKLNAKGTLQFLAAYGSDADPSYHTVWRAGKRAERENPHLFALARDGLTKFRNDFQLSSTHPLVMPGSRLSVDSTVADQWARIVDPHTEEGWAAIRPVLTVVQDIGSRLLVAFNLSLCPVDSGIVSGTVLRAVSQDAQDLVHPGLPSLGVPFEVATDGGPEHLKTFSAALRRLGIEHIKGGDNNPQKQAHVERLIATVQLEVFRNQIGYSATHKRFDPYAPAEKDAKRSLSQLKYDGYKLEVPVTALPTLEEVEQRILAWAIDYNERPHPSLPKESVLIRALRLGQDHADLVHGRAA
jgi:transposase InsO family protein